MIALLGFFSELLHGIELGALALGVGGPFYVLFVLRVFSARSETTASEVDRVLHITVGGMVLVVLIRLFQLGLTSSMMPGLDWSTGLGAFLQTEVFWVEAFGIFLAVSLVGALHWVRRGPHHPVRWEAAMALTLCFFGNEVWLGHAASRVESSRVLMIVTGLHKFGALIWAGGVVHLFLGWLREGRSDGKPVPWPVLVSRFSPIGMLSVALILIPGLYLSWHYVGSWAGLVGTGYGNMLGVKMVLFLCILTFAAINFLAAVSWKRSDSFQNVPVYLEAEILLGGAVLFTAAALASFPPSTDVMSQSATPSELWVMFKPKAPQLTGPEMIMVESVEKTDLRTGTIGYKEELSWDQFNHNMSGVILLGIVCVALLDRTKMSGAFRHWPLLFSLFAVLIVVFANPDYWPLGPVGFLESAQHAEVVQHWLAALVAFGLGVIEWRARLEPDGRTLLQLGFPFLCMGGGVLLLTHSHSIVELKQEFLIQSTHVVMGMIGIIIGCGRWLEIRLPAPHGPLAGLVSIGFLLVMAFILIFYVNPEKFYGPYAANPSFIVSVLQQPFHP